MIRTKTTIAIAGAGVLLLMLLGACALDSEAATHDPGQSAEAEAPQSFGVVQAASAATWAPMLPSAAAWNGIAAGEAGIWVNGQGKASVEPDLAVVNLGVESTEMTIAEANGNAARAMDAIMKSLAANGIADEDIQTHNFNVQPRYERVEIEENGRRSNRQELIGYRVSNSLTAKIRDLTTVGTVIDQVITAGGDATRFNNLNFTVEDTSALLSSLREQAVKDAMAKAAQIATVSGVSLGSLAYITDLPGAGSSNPFGREQAFFAAAAAVADTSVSGGQIEVSLTLQAAFVIE